MIKNLFEPVSIKVIVHIIEIISTRRHNKNNRQKQQKKKIIGSKPHPLFYVLFLFFFNPHPAQESLFIVHSCSVYREKCILLGKRKYKPFLTMCADFFSWEFADTLHHIKCVSTFEDYIREFLLFYLFRMEI